MSLIKRSATNLRGQKQSGDRNRSTGLSSSSQVFRMLPALTVLKSSLSVFLALPVLIITVIVLVPVASIALVVRALVWALAKCIRPDLDSFVMDMNSAMALRNSRKAALNVFGTSVMKGILTKEQIQECIQTRVLPLRDPKTEELLYEKLQMSWEGFLGYAFWKRDKNFDLNNHVRHYDYGGKLRLPDPCTQSDLRKVLPGFSDAPWDRSRSPWEVLIIPNYTDEQDVVWEEKCPKTAFIIRVDHILGDGYSALGLLKEATQSPFNVPEFKFAKKEFSIWKTLGLFVKMPWDVLQMFSMPLLYSPLRNFKGHSKEDMIMSFSSPIDVSVVKKIKNHFRVHYVSVIHAALFGAIGNVLMDAGVKIPRSILVNFMVPTLDRPAGLCVRVIAVHAAWPLTPCSPEKNLLRTHRTLKSMTQTAGALTVPYIIRASAYLPMFARDLMIRYGTSGVSAIITNFPVTTGPDYFEGCEFLECAGSLGSFNEVGILVTNGGVNNKQTITFAVNKSVFPTEEMASNLGAYVEREIQNMLNATV